MNEAVITIFNLIILGGGMIYFARKGTPQAANDVIKILDARDKEQKETIESLREEGRQTALKLANLEGVVSEKDKKIQEYLDILRGNSPDEVQYRTEMRANFVGVAKYMSDSGKYMKDSAEIFSSMKTFMTQLNEKAQTNQDRNVAQDAE